MVVGIEVTIIAIAYVIVSLTMQRKLVNPKLVYETQQVIKVKTKELNELSKNKASQDQLSAKQKEITTLLSQSMRSQLKPMFVVLPFFIVLYYVLFPMAFPSDPNITFLSMTFGYRSYFILVAFVAGIVSSTGIGVYDKIKRDKEQRAQTETKPV